jgi:predicted CXXCH cytochrome family protein
MFVLGSTAQAGQHPVSLGKNPDASKCIECHADKTKGAHMHSAMAMGCTTCHIVTQAQGATVINLIAPSKALCFSCHAKSTEKVLHEPYSQGNCIVCHSPHSSDQPNQLLASTQVLCMGCHVRGGLKVDKLRRRAAFPWGATLGLDQLKGLKTLGLNKALSANHPVIGHPISGPNTAAGNGVGQVNCLSCHQAHHSVRRNLLPARFVSQTALCESCHKGEF